MKQLHDNVPLVTLSSAADYFSVGPTYQSYNIDGAGGNDQLITSYGNDTVNGGAGNDYIYSPGGNDLLSGGDGDDLVIFGGGYGSKAILNGDAGNDHLIDYSGSATLSGGAGNDTIEGGGRDVMSGGTGADTFKIINTGPPIQATVKDLNFAQGDKIDLTSLGSWSQNGYQPLTAANLEVQGHNLVAHTVFGDAVIQGAGDQVTLIGLAHAIAVGDIVL